MSKDIEFFKQLPNEIFQAIIFGYLTISDIQSLLLVDKFTRGFITSTLNTKGKHMLESDKFSWYEVGSYLIFLKFKKEENVQGVKKYFALNYRLGNEYLKNWAKKSFGSKLKKVASYMKQLSKAYEEKPNENLANIEIFTLYHWLFLKTKSGDTNLKKYFLKMVNSLVIHSDENNFKSIMILISLFETSMHDKCKEFLSIYVLNNQLLDIICRYEILYKMQEKNMLPNITKLILASNAVLIADLENTEKQLSHVYNVNNPLNVISKYWFCDSVNQGQEYPNIPQDRIAEFRNYDFDFENTIDYKEMLKKIKLNQLNKEGFVSFTDPSDDRMMNIPLGNYIIILSLLNKDLTTIDELSNIGYNFALKDSKRENVLYFLMKLNNEAKLNNEFIIGFISSLVKEGVNVNAKNRNKNTPLIIALYNESNNDFKSTIVQTLLDNGADPCIVNKEGKTALDIAIEKSLDDCVKLLSDKKYLDKYPESTRSNLTKYNESKQSNWVSFIETAINNPRLHSPM